MSTPGTVNYPTTLDDSVSLFEVANNAITSLSVAAASGDATLNVASTGLFPTTGAITIDAEIIYYTGKTGTTFTGCLRGQDGTSAASHLINVTVSGFITARHFAAHRDAIVAVETAAVTKSTAQTITAVKTFTPASGTAAINITAGQYNTSSQFRSKATKVAAQSIPGSTFTALTFDTNTYDVGPVHSTSSNPTRFTAPTGGAGIWLFSGTAGIVPGAGTLRVLAVFRNGVEIARVSASPLGGGWNTDINISIPVLIADADFVEFQVFQDSGGALNTVPAETFGSAYKLG